MQRWSPHLGLKAVEHSETVYGIFSVRERCILKVLNEHVKHFPREAPKLDVIVDAGEANARDEFLFSIREAQLMSLDFPDPTIEIVHQLTGVHEFEARPTANYIESDISIYKTFSRWLRPNKILNTTQTSILRESAKVFLNMKFVLIYQQVNQ